MTTTAQAQAQVKERPIIMQPESIRAILDGRKTQTRRVIKLAYEKYTKEWAAAVHPARESGWIAWWPNDSPDLAEFTKLAYTDGFQCPYGKPGDRLWCRETFWYQDWLNLPSSEPQPIHYSADGNTQCLEDYKQKPSIFMPRWASRITLEITDVRVERLQAISEADAIAEGVYTNDAAIKKLGLPANTRLTGSCVDKYRIVWESINGKTFPWSANPWVWSISFRRVEV